MGSITEKSVRCQYLALPDIDLSVIKKIVENFVARKLIIFYNFASFRIVGEMVCVRRIEKIIS